MILPVRWIEVPDCVQPYHLAPVIIGCGTFLAVLLIIAVVALLVVKWS